ncbi:MAG: flagellar protein FlgN [Limnobacter sp.]|nr:flagellar protein FlgN [Limnobacter sp.]
MFELEKRYKANLKHARQAGFPESFEGFQAWVDLLATTDVHLRGNFQTLLDALHHSQRLNAMNGEIVQEQLLGLQQRICILTAASLADPHQPTDTYGPKGSMGSGNSSTSRAARAIIR